MMGRSVAVPLMLLALASCSGGEGSSAGNTANAAPSAAAALEQAAVDAGVVTRADGLSPVGLYRRRHEAGLDSLCIVDGVNGETLFGVEAVFGRGISCRGQGTLSRSGDRLILTFAGSTCRIEAQYKGDRVIFPGMLDPACSHLCTKRGSLEGVSLPRVSREESVARDARAQDRTRLCR